MFANGFNSSQQEGLHAVVDNLASVFGRKHEMEVGRDIRSMVNDDRRLVSRLMIEESTAQEQADAEKAMHPIALRLGYCGPGIDRLLLSCMITHLNYSRIKHTS